MTILAATHFPDKITAFALVSAGDPYGTHMDMGTHPRFERPTAPGVFRDNETKKLISETGAATAAEYRRERPWPDTDAHPKPWFKQFHHERDGAVNVSCMRKARGLLVEHGYRDAGLFLVEEKGRPSIWKHFWQSEYNRPLIDFFKNPGGKTTEELRK